jgi:2-oxoglutarate dehydrogenase C-terminal
VECFYVQFFPRVIPETGPASQDPSSVKKLIFCTGKVFYDINKARIAGNLDKDIAIARVEQVCADYYPKSGPFFMLEISDFSIPIRPCEEGVRQVPQRSAVLGSGRAQEPGCLELCPAQIQHRPQQIP